MPAEVKFVGDEAAMSDLRKWADEVAPAVVKASGPFAQRVADTIAGRVPVLTGSLAASVETTDDDDGVSVGYDGSLAYAGWIEFGGSRGRSHVPEGRYVYPSAMEAQDEFAQVAGDAAADSVGRFSWSTAH